MGHGVAVTGCDLREAASLTSSQHCAQCASVWPSDEGWHPGAGCSCPAHVRTEVLPAGLWGPPAKTAFLGAPAARGCSRPPPLADIQFWNSRQSLEGLSVRSVFFGVFQSFVVLLYILDNETNFVVQVSVFIGVLIDLWKITKVMDVRVCQPARLRAWAGVGLLHRRPWSWPLGLSRRLLRSQDQGDFHTRGFFGSYVGQGNWEPWGGHVLVLGWGQQSQGHH